MKERLEICCSFPYFHSISLDNEARLLIAIELYCEGKISLGKPADIANLNIRELLSRLIILYSFVIRIPFSHLPSHVFGSPAAVSWTNKLRYRRRRYLSNVPTSVSLRIYLQGRGVRV
ncbi:MAG: UPF0175 family protein [Archaeoglobaceae archaeon]